MEIVVQFNEKDIEPVIIKAITHHVERLVNSITERIVIDKFTSPITEAVEVHLAKRLTNEDIKKVIDRAIEARLRDFDA